MASASKVRWSQLRVGMMALAALGILVYLVILLTGSKGLFQSTTVVYTFMDDAATIADGAPVTLNGINVGKVQHAELSGLNQPRRIVRIILEIDDDNLAAIPDDSEAAISAANLLGTKFINIKKGKSPTPIHAGSEIRSLDVSDFEDVVQQGYSTLAGLKLIVSRVDGIISQIEVGKGTIGTSESKCSNTNGRASPETCMMTLVLA